MVLHEEAPRQDPAPKAPRAPTLSMVGGLRTTSKRCDPTCSTRPAAHASPLGTAGSMGLLQWEGRMM